MFCRFLTVLPSLEFFDRGFANFVSSIGHQEARGIASLDEIFMAKDGSLPSLSRKCLIPGEIRILPSFIVLNSRNAANPMKRFRHTEHAEALKRHPPRLGYSHRSFGIYDCDVKVC